MRDSTYKTAFEYVPARPLYSRPYAYVKRFLDILFSFLLALPAALIVLGCYIAVKAETKGPAFFVQSRPGYRGRIFRIFKLRTMTVETERDGHALSDMERMTKTGRVIRALSLDELPQIFNVLLGQMSFIGPRPLLEQYLPLYDKEQMRRHDVLPGISGWAQVNGRNELSWEQKFARDVWYVDHMSFLLDLRITGLTIRNVFERNGINAGVSDTMSVFGGSADKTVKPAQNPPMTEITTASGTAGSKIPAANTAETLTGRS